MGSWAATCPVSRLAINPGDKVFYIWSRKSYATNTYGLLQELSSSIRWHETYSKDVERLEKEIELFSKETCGEEFMKSLEESLCYYKAMLKEVTVKYGWGEYDDYGGVEGEDLEQWKDGEDDESNVSHLVLIRGDVAKSMIELGRSWIKPSSWEPNEKPYKNNEAYCLALVAHSTRLQLFGFQLLGRQYPEFDEYKEVLSVQKIILKEIVKEFARQIWSDIKYKYDYLDIDIKYWFKNLFSRKAK